MKNILLNINTYLFTLIFISSAFTVAVAQDLNSDTKIRIKIEKDVDGEKQIIDRVFTDPNDPELKELMGDNDISINGNSIKSNGSKKFKLNLDTDDPKSVEEFKMKLNEIADELDIDINIDEDAQIFNFKGNNGQRFDFDIDEWDDLPESFEKLGIDRAKLNDQLKDMESSINNIDFEQFQMHNFGAAPNKAVMGVTISDNENGVKIESLQDDFGALQAGLQEGDIITEIDREEVTSVDDVIDYLKDKEPGDKVNVKYIRNDKESKVKVKLSERENMPSTFMFKGCDPSDCEDENSIFENFNLNDIQSERIDGLLENGFGNNNFFNKQNTRIMVMITDLSKSDNEELENISPNANLKEMSDFEVEAIEFFPNPSKGIFNLKFNSSKAADTEINVYDVNGQSVYQRILLDFAGDFNENIDLDNPSSGTYILEVVRNNKRMNKKIVIQ